MDPLCELAEAALVEQGLEAIVLDRLFSAEGCFTWRTTGAASWSRIQEPGSAFIDSGQIEGVLVRDSPWTAGESWSDRDGQYMQEEAQAATLGWLRSLPCRVVGRLPAWLFFQAQPGFLTWVPMLQRAGLETLDTVVSSDPSRLRAWQSRHPEGAVLSSLLGGSHLRVATEAEWSSVLKVARHAPVSLKEPHGELQLACLVGQRVIWNGPSPKDAPQLEECILRFASAAELDFVQIALAPVLDEARGLAVVGVEVRVQLHLFDRNAQEAIVDAVVESLTGIEGPSCGTRHSRQHASADDSRRHL
jgi:hypothetical protein